MGNGADTLSVYLGAGQRAIALASRRHQFKRVRHTDFVNIMELVYLPIISYKNAKRTSLASNVSGYPNTSDRQSPYPEASCGIFLTDVHGCFDS